MLQPVGMQRPQKRARSASGVLRSHFRRQSVSSVGGALAAAPGMNPFCFSLLSGLTYDCVKRASVTDEIDPSSKPAGTIKVAESIMILQNTEWALVRGSALGHKGDPVTRAYCCTKDGRKSTRGWVTIEQQFEPAAPPASTLKTSSAVLREREKNLDQFERAGKPPARSPAGGSPAPGQKPAASPTASPLYPANPAFLDRDDHRPARRPRRGRAVGDGAGADDVSEPGWVISPGSPSAEQALQRLHRRLSRLSTNEMEGARPAPASLHTAAHTRSAWSAVIP